MITGAHAIIYSTSSEKDRAFFQDVLALPNVDVGGGWLIFGLPPAEIAVHPADKNDVHEIYLMTEDIEAFIVPHWTEAARRYAIYRTRTLREFGEEPEFQLADLRPAARSSR